MRLPGRIFTQEDPIGLAGGLNLYGFAGGDPVNFSDPFGLKVCYSGSARQVQQLKAGTEEATGTTITLDDNNCVASFESTGAKGYEEIQEIFAGLVESDIVFGARFDRPDESDRYFTSNFDRRTNTAIILQGEVGRRWYQTGNRFTCGVFGGTPGPRYTLGGLIAHELLGHGGGVLSSGRPAGERQAIRVENLYHAARGQPRRC